MYSYIHCVSKKFPPLNSLYLCQILTDFQNFCTAGKRTKLATKPIQPYPPHLRHANTLLRHSVYINVGVLNASWLWVVMASWPATNGVGVSSVSAASLSLGRLEQEGWPPPTTAVAPTNASSWGVFLAAVVHWSACGRARSGTLHVVDGGWPSLHRLRVSIRSS